MFEVVVARWLLGCLLLAAVFFFLAILSHGKRATYKTHLVLSGLSLVSALLIIWKGSISPAIQGWTGEYDLECGGHLGLNMDMSCWLSAGDIRWHGKWAIQEGDSAFLKLQFGDNQLIVLGTNEPFKAEVSHLPETIFGVPACNLQRRPPEH